MATVINLTVPATVDATIQSLEEANREYTAKINSNNHLLDEYRWQRDWAAIDTMQQEIAKQALTPVNGKKPLCWEIYLTEAQRQQMSDPFTIDKLEGTLLVGYLKDYRPWDNLPHSHFVSFNRVFFIEPSHRTDEGKYRVGVKEKHTVGVTQIHCNRLNLFNKDTFKDEEVYEYLRKFADLLNVI